MPTDERTQPFVSVCSRLRKGEKPRPDYPFVSVCKRIRVGRAVIPPRLPFDFVHVPVFSFICLMADVLRIDYRLYWGLYDSVAAGRKMACGKRVDVYDVWTVGLIGYGEGLTCSELARMVGVKYKRMDTRLRNGIFRGFVEKRKVEKRVTYHLTPVGRVVFDKINEGMRSSLDAIRADLLRSLR